MRAAPLAVTVALVVSSCTTGAPSDSLADPTTTPQGEPTGTTVPTSTAEPGPTTTVAEPLPPGLIGIRAVDGVAEFYEVATNEKWIPRGSNLVHTDPNTASPLSVHDYDADWNDARLAAMEELGFNAVRVMFELCTTGHCVAGPGERVAPDFLDNATEFLEMAARHGIRVMYTSNDLPGDSWYAREAFVEGESDFLTPRNIEVYAEYFSDILDGLMARDAPLDWLWSLEIRNEFVYQLDSYPWNLTEGTFTAANGSTYDMGSAPGRGALSTDLLTHWADEMTATIKSIRPDTLVSIGLLSANDNVTPFGAEDPRWLIAGDFHETTDVEFFDIHGGRASVQEAMERYNMFDIDTKPVIVGEFGAAAVFAGSIDIVAALAAGWQTVSCRGGFDGWLTWHWTGRDGERWPVEGTIIGETLAPSLHPDPCAEVPVRVQQVSWHRPVTASATEADIYGPQNLTDSDPESYWSAGAGTPQWFEIEFAEPATLGRLRLPIGTVTPDGPLVIDVYGYAPESSEGSLLHTFDTTMAPGDILEHTLSPPVENIARVRFTIRTMRDWVILHGVEVYRADE